jgi:hypothetical protein
LRLGGIFAPAPPVEKFEKAATAGNLNRVCRLGVDPADVG